MSSDISEFLLETRGLTHQYARPGRSPLPVLDGVDL
jgi:hypothetical protein